jgi:ABC-2 type transport system ATP-binding protein
MPGKFALYQDLSVEENLKLFATIYGSTIDEHYELIKPIYSQIEPFKKRKAGDLSGGMKQKLALSCCLIHKPEILFLDEPTTGVDPVSRKEFWEMLANLKKENITIFVSTPYMDEAELCDRVALIQNGNILTTDTPRNIRNNFPHTLYAFHNTEKYKLLKFLMQFQYTDNVYPFGEAVHYIDKRKQINIEHFKQELNSAGLANTEIELIKPTIEDCFISFMMEKTDG